MASMEAGRSVTLLAGSDFTGDIYKLAEVSGVNTVNVVNATTDTVVGVIGEEVLQGQECPLVLLTGRVKVRAGGTITVGQLLIPAADGEVTGVADINSIPADTMAVGVALQAGADGEIIEMLAQPMVGNLSV